MVGTMKDRTNQEQAVDLLQQLGLKEYEAKSFVALTRVPHGTAKDISELSEVPRTRVYDAARVLEAKGLVEVQHTNPQQFRAVSIEEAAETLRRGYESDIDTFVEALRGLEPATLDVDREVTHEVWALSGTTAIENRTEQLVGEAEEEVVIILGCDGVVTDGLLARLNAVHEAGVTVVVGTRNESIREKVQEALPEVKVFVSELQWLTGSVLDSSHGTTITRLLLVDKNTILVSSASEIGGFEDEREQAVFGRGFDNGIVVIARRLMATGLLAMDDPDEIS